MTNSNELRVRLDVIRSRIKSLDQAFKAYAADCLESRKVRVEKADPILQARIAKGLPQKVEPGNDFVLVAKVTKELPPGIDTSSRQLLGELHDVLNRIAQSATGLAEFPFAETAKKFDAKIEGMAGVSSEAKSAFRQCTPAQEAGRRLWIFHMLHDQPGWSLSIRNLVIFCTVRGRRPEDLGGERWAVGLEDDLSEFQPIANSDDPTTIYDGPRAFLTFPLWMKPSIEDVPQFLTAICETAEGLIDRLEASGKA